MYLNQLQFGAIGTCELWELYPKSFLMDDVFDDAIMGINPLNGSIIYSLTEMVNCYLDIPFFYQIPNDKESQIKLFQQIIEKIKREFEDLTTSKELNDKGIVLPTLFQEFQWESKDNTTEFEECVRIDVGFRRNTTCES